MAPQAYKVVSTHANEILEYTILSRLLHSHDTHLGYMNGDVQSDLATLASNSGEKFEYFHSIIIRLQPKIILSGETVSPTRLLFQYTKAFLKSINQSIHCAKNDRYYNIN